MWANLDGYAEQGLSSEALTYNALSFRSTSAVLGLRGSYDIAMDWGTLSPTARLEYRQGFDSDFSQSMFYSDLGAATASAFTQASATRNLVSGAIGLRADAGQGLAADVEYGATAGSGAVLIQTLRGTLRISY